MNTFGRILRVSIYGESHTEGVGVIIDGYPAGIKIDYERLTQYLNRRKSGIQGTTSRIEADIPKILSGVYNSKTTGAPINIFFENRNINSKDYSFVNSTPRPGHSDFTAHRKYLGFNDFRGGGAFSGRLTLGIVAAGVLSMFLLPKISIEATVISIHGEENNKEAIEKTIKRNDSAGGIIECKIQGLPVGIGEPFFDSIESNIAHLAFSIPGVIGIEFGAGFAGTNLYGSEFNDKFKNSSGETTTNNSGGINGGISNGNEIVFRVALKPTSSIPLLQNTYNFKKNEIEPLQISGRHDRCFVLRVPPIIESIAAIVLSDLFLIRNSQLSCRII